MAEFRQQVLAAVERHGMLSPGDRVLVALSGGQDSLSLLHCLHKTAGELDIELAAGHLHHGMRGEVADADEAFLAELCQGMGVCLFSRRVSVPGIAQDEGISLEEAGRKARYEFLHQTAENQGCGKIALGHTATDRAETVLMNILRGAGLEGLRGIAPVNGKVIRPLITVTRQQTGHYCSKIGIDPRLDSTNLDTDHALRNRVRLELMPLIEEQYSQGAEAALLRLAEAAEAEIEWTGALVAEAFAGAVRSDEPLGLGIEALAGMPTGLLRRVVRQAIGQVAGGLSGISMGHVDAVVSLVRGGRTGAELNLPFEVLVKRGYNCVEFMSGAPAAWEHCHAAVALMVPGETRFSGGLVRAALQPPPDDPTRARGDEAYLDATVAGESLTVRAWQDGDRIQPLGMSGTRKLQDLFVDLRVPRLERHRIPVVVNTDSQVLWVAGLCVSQLAALTPATRECVHLSWWPGDQD